MRLSFRFLAAVSAAALAAHPAFAGPPSSNGPAQIPDGSIQGRQLAPGAAVGNGAASTTDSRLSYVTPQQQAGFFGDTQISARGAASIVLTAGSQTGTLSGVTLSAADVGKLFTANVGGSTFSTTLTAVSGNTLSFSTAPAASYSGATRIAWGHDDCAALTAWANALVGGAEAYLPTGTYGTSCSISLPTARTTLVHGGGRGSATIVAMKAMTDLLVKQNSGYYGSPRTFIENLTLDGNALATNVLHLGYHGSSALFVDAFNAAPGGSNVLSDGSNEQKLLYVYAVNDDTIYPTTASLPAYNFYITSTDTHVVGNEGVNAGTANFRDNAGGGYYTNNHAYSFPISQFGPQYDFWLGAGVKFVGNYADTGFTTSGVYLDGNGSNINSNQLAQDSTRTGAGAYGISLASGVARASVVGNTSNGNFGGLFVVKQLGTADATTTIENNAGAFYNTGQNELSGNYAFARGLQNLARGPNTNCFGKYCLLTGDSSSAFGSNGKDYGRKANLLLSFNAFAAQGDNQSVTMQLAGATADNTTAVPLLVDNSGNPAANNQISAQTNQTIGFWCTFTARASGGASKTLTINGGVENNAGTMAWVGGSAPSATVTVADSAASAWSITATLDSTYKAPRFTATGGPANYRGTCRNEELLK